MTMQQQRIPLAQQLLASGLVTAVQLDLARREQERNGGHGYAPGNHRGTP